MSNRPKNGWPRREPQPPMPQPQAHDLSQSTTVAVATGVKVHLSRPDQLDGQPCMLLTFVNGDTEFTPPFLLIANIENFDEATHACTEDIKKILAEIESGAPAAGEEVHNCQGCGTRIFGNLIEVGLCVSCQKEPEKGEKGIGLRVIQGGAEG